MYIYIYIWCHIIYTDNLFALDTSQVDSLCHSLWQGWKRHKASSVADTNACEVSEPKTLAVLVWGWWRHCDYHWSWLPSNKRFQAFGPSLGEPIKFKTSKALSICRSHLWKWNSYAHLPARWLIHWCSLPWFYQFLRSCLNGNLENIWRWLCWRTWQTPASDQLWACGWHAETLRGLELWIIWRYPWFCMGRRAESQRLRVELPTSVCRSSTWQVLSGTPTSLTCRLKGGACPSKTQQDSWHSGLGHGKFAWRLFLGMGPSHASASTAFGSARALWRDHEEDTRSMLLGCQCLW